MTEEEVKKLKKGNYIYQKSRPGYGYGIIEKVGRGKDEIFLGRTEDDYIILDDKVFYIAFTDGYTRMIVDEYEMATENYSKATKRDFDRCS